MKGICGNVTNIEVFQTMRFSIICILFVIVNIATYSVFKKAVDLHFSLSSLPNSNGTKIKFAVYSEYSAHGSRHNLLPLRIFYLHVSVNPKVAVQVLSK